MQWNGRPHCKFDGKSMETETTTRSGFPNGGKAVVEQILVSEERNKSKRAGLWESQSGICLGKLTIWVSSFEIWFFGIDFWNFVFLTKFTRSISSTRIGKPVLMMNVEVYIVMILIACMSCFSSGTWHCLYFDQNKQKCKLGKLRINYW